MGVNGKNHVRRKRNPKSEVKGSLRKVIWYEK